MPSSELQALAARLGRPVQSLGPLDRLPQQSLAELLEAVDKAEVNQREALEAAYAKAFPAWFWRLLRLGEGKPSG